MANRGLVCGLERNKVLEFPQLCTTEGAGRFGSFRHGLEATVSDSGISPIRRAIVMEHNEANCVKHSPATP